TNLLGCCRTDFQCNGTCGAAGEDDRDPRWTAFGLEGALERPPGERVL
ncbi:MAG: hypothetical protein ACI9SE_000832, partial [Neolewinella sp.]